MPTSVSDGIAPERQIASRVRLDRSRSSDVEPAVAHVGDHRRHLAAAGELLVDQPLGGERLRPAHLERVALVGGFLLQRALQRRHRRPRARATARSPPSANRGWPSAPASWPQQLEPAANAFDLGDDALLGVDVDPRRVEVERHGRPPPSSTETTTSHPWRWAIERASASGLSSSSAVSNASFVRPILGLGHVRVDRLEWTLERRQVRAGARFLVLLVAAAGRERDAPDSEHGDSDDGDQPPHPHSARNLASPDRLLIVSGPTFVQLRRRSLRASRHPVVASAV